MQVKTPFRNAVVKVDYYIDALDVPTSHIEYEACGAKLYGAITDEISKSMKWFHKYHKCSNCKRCHRCPKCGGCFIGKNWTTKCMGCQWRVHSCFNAEVPIWNCEKCEKWRHSLRLFINNRELLSMGVSTYENVYDKNAFERVEQVATKMKETNHNDGTVEKVKGKNKHFYGAKYVWTIHDRKLNLTWKHGGTVRTNVAPIPMSVFVEVVRALELLGLIRSNSVNAVGLNDYLYHGIESHYDGKHKFDLFSNIYTVRMYNDAVIKFRCKRWFKNPLCAIVLKRSVVCELHCVSFGSDWIKHCLSNLDFAGPNAAFILRRVYPFLLLWSKQCADKF